jgi:hypothetical protein
VGVANGDYFYRRGQPTKPDRGAISDWGTATEVLTGYESLFAADGRVLNSLAMSGRVGGTRYDCGGDPIDVNHIQAGMDLVKTRVGQGKYSWKMMCMSPETNATFIEGREVDRRFVSAEDGTRGVRKWFFVHNTDSLEVYTTEYCPFKRIYMLPENKNGDKVLEYHGTDFMPVEGDGLASMHLPASGNTHLKIMNKYLQAWGVLISRHSPAGLVLHNFTL